jgi:hypothetical protein
VLDPIAQCRDVKTAVIVPGAAPDWVANYARHVAQSLTRSGRVLVAFTHAPAVSVLLPGQSKQGSLLGHSVSGYPLWTGRVSAVLGLRRRANDAIFVLWNRARWKLALISAAISRLRGERVTLVITEPHGGDGSIVNLLCRRLFGALAHNVVGIDHAWSGDRTRLAVALCGSDAAIADLVVRSIDAMPDATARQWRFVLQVSRLDPAVTTSSSRQRELSIHIGEPSRRRFAEADVVIAPFNSPMKSIVSEAVLLGGVGVLVGGPLAGRVFRQADGVWIARHECAALIVAFEAAASGVSDCPHSIESMRLLAHEAVQAVAPGRLDDAA